MDESRHYFMLPDGSTRATLLLGQPGGMILEVDAEEVYEMLADCRPELAGTPPDAAKPPATQ